MTMHAVTFIPEHRHSRDVGGILVLIGLWPKFCDDADSIGI